MHKYQLLRLRADEFLSALEEYSKTDPNVEDLKGWFMPWYGKIQRREIRLPCYEYQLSHYFSNPDLSPIAEKYAYVTPRHPLAVASTHFSEAMRDWLSDPAHLAYLKAAGEQPSAILDELPPPDEEAPLPSILPVEPPVRGIKKWLHRWLKK